MLGDKGYCYLHTRAVSFLKKPAHRQIPSAPCDQIPRGRGVCVAAYERALREHRRTTIPDMLGPGAAGHGRSNADILSMLSRKRGAAETGAAEAGGRAGLKKAKASGRDGSILAFASRAGGVEQAQEAAEGPWPCQMCTYVWSGRRWGCARP
jgi:hypothetical protein